MSSKSSSPHLGGNFVTSFVSDNIVKFLDDEFAKFEALAKDCDRYTVMDVKLPVRMIELFYKLFQMCVENTALWQNIDGGELFKKIFLSMRSHFEKKCCCGLEAEEIDESDDDDLNDDEELEASLLSSVLNFINQQQINPKDEVTKKMLQELESAKDWLLEQNGVLMCEVCNAKCNKWTDLIAHSITSTHTKNLETFKTNQVYIAFPDSDNESFGCKVCKSEYSNLNSLIKHLDKPLHAEAKKKFDEQAKTVKADPKKSSNKETKPKPNPCPNNVVKFTAKSTNDSSKPANVVNGSFGEIKPIIKTVPGDKKLINVVPKEVAIAKMTNNTLTKTKAKDTADVTPKSQPKPADNVAQTKNITNVAAKIQPKVSETSKNPTNVAPKAQSKVSETSKNPTNVAPKAQSKVSETPKNTTNVTPKAQPKASETPKNTTNMAPKSQPKPSETLKNITNATPKAQPKATDTPKNTTNIAPNQAKSSDTISAEPATESTSNKTTTSTKPPTQAKTNTKPTNKSKFIISRDSTSKYCQICMDIIPDEAALLAHIAEKEHIELVSAFESNQEYVKMSICGTDFFCILCGTKCYDLNDLACHFLEIEHKRSLKSTHPEPTSPVKPKQTPVAKPKPAQKPPVKNILNNAKLSDSDKKFLRQKANQAVCLVCNTTLNNANEVLDHINVKLHAQNVLDFVKHEQYVQLPGDKATSFNCSKCNSIFDTFEAVLIHCKSHEPQFKLKKSDEKFISKGKSEKSSKCSLCDKELPTVAALISHTDSSNHLKNYNTFTKNEPYYVAGKNSCSLCEITCNDLASLVKHFKSDTHQKTTIKGKKAHNQPSIHIPSYSKIKVTEIMEQPIEEKSPKGAAPKKDKKSEVSAPRKSRLQLFSMNEQNFDELTFEQFPMKRPDNSYVIAKNDLFYCRICNSDLPAVEVASHMNGATHRINAEVFESLQCHVSSSSDCVKCTSCQLTFDNVHLLIKHFREKIHAKPTTPAEKAADPEPVFDLTSTDLAEKIILNPKDIKAEKPKPEKANGSPKRVKIPRSDRQHLFRLTGTTVQCNLCNMKLSDNDALQSHIDNLNHKRNSSLFIENETSIRQLDSVESKFECIPCAFTGDLNKVLKHCKKKQHALAKGCEQVEVVSENETQEDDPEVDRTLTEFDLKCVHMKNGIVRCKICHSKLTSEKNLLEHMNSLNHKTFSAIYKMNEPFIEKFDEIGYSYKCIICEVIFTRLDTMIRHFSEPGHHCETSEEHRASLATEDKVKLNVETYNFECILCSVTFVGFADLSKHCHSAQHEVLKSIIQSAQNEIPYNITITDYQFHCHACNVRMLNKALMEKHVRKRIHIENANFYVAESRNGEPRPNVIEIVGYEYLCNLCWLPMYSAAELAVHEQSNMHKSGKDFDDLWRFNEKHLIMYENMYKVRCKLCEKTIGIERFIKHCTSRDHRMRFIANHLEESGQDQYIVWRNATQYCTLCDCKLINDHNLVNHVNSEKHKLKLLQN